MHKDRISWLKKEIQIYGSFKKPNRTQKLLLLLYQNDLKRLESEDRQT